MGINCLRFKDIEIKEPEIDKTKMDTIDEEPIIVIPDRDYELLTKQSASIHHAVEVVHTIQDKLIAIEKSIDHQIKITSPAVHNRKKKVQRNTINKYSIVL